MQQQINALAEKVAALTALQSANHAENRRDIHRLNNGQQDLLDAITSGIEKIADKIGVRMDGMQGDIHQLQIAWAKATGYVLALSAVAGIIFSVAAEAVRSTLTHLLH